MFNKRLSVIVILAINAKYIHSSLSAWVLAAHLPNSVVIESNINQENADILKPVMSHKPTVIAISVYIWNATKVKKIIELIREHSPETAIVLGGPEATHNADYWYSVGADHVFIGEFDKDFIDPYSTKCLKALEGKLAYIETSRGCPFSCAFCLSGDGCNVKFLPLEEAKRRIKKLADSDVRMLKFVDRTFNCNTERAFQIIEYVIKLKTNKCFHFEVAADLFDARTLSLLSTAPPGRIQFEIGLQSFFEPALKASFRKTDLPKAVQNIKTLLSYGNIHIHIDLIAGLPYETIDDFVNSFNRAFWIKAHHLQLGFLKLLHGSKMRELYPEISHSDTPPYEITKSIWLSAENLSKLKRIEHTLEQTYNKGLFVNTFYYVLEVCRDELTPLELFRKIDESPENIFNFCKSLNDLNKNVLLKHMICDFMAKQKGMNMPRFMRIGTYEEYRAIRTKSEDILGRKIHRSEVAVIPDSTINKPCGVFVNLDSRNPVTGLYELYFV
ncbi:MAG: DUF4080 domain-containing protein [Oscillospiraceae bacterium]|nr:DUF4080 domain-containing protein [Oscillospiraceae bacterium]